MKSQRKKERKKNAIQWFSFHFSLLQHTWCDASTSSTCLFHLFFLRLGRLLIYSVCVCGLFVFGFFFLFCILVYSYSMRLKFTYSRIRTKSTSSILPTIGLVFFSVQCVNKFYRQTQNTHTHTRTGNGDTNLLTHGSLYSVQGKKSFSVQKKVNLKEKKRKCDPLGVE